MRFTCLMGFSPVFHKEKIVIYKADGKKYSKCIFTK